MSVLAADPPLDQIDGDNTPAWEAYRKQRGTTDERKTIPRGTYEATLIETALVRRKDAGGFLLRMVSRTNHLGVYLVSWRGLSNNEFDPYKLTDNQIKNLRKFAEQMGIQVPAPAHEIIHAIQQMVGAQVEAKVAHGPTGIQTTLTRPGAAVPAVAAGEVVPAGDYDGGTAVAQQAHQQVLSGLRRTREGLIQTAAGCHALAATEGWRALGYESLVEYLAAPEITLSRSEFYRAADIFKTYVMEGGVEPTLLIGAGESKLEVPLPAIKQGLVDASTAAADAEALTRKALRDKYRELGGDVLSERVPDVAPPTINVTVVDESPAGGTDSPWQDEVRDADGNLVDMADLAGWVERNGHPEAWAKKAQELDGKYEVASDQLALRGARIAELEAELQAAREPQTDLEHMSVAQGLALVLARVLREIGAPEQKRMGRDLRAAVAAALDQAREAGLDVE